MSTATEIPRQNSGFRPAEPIGVGPLFQWPPRFAALLKWLFGFPGYLWPWKTLFLGISVMSWLFLTPDINRMRTLSADWIAEILARNVALLFAFTGIWHICLYVRRTQGTNYKYNSNWLSEGNRQFLFSSQLRDNVFWSVCSGVPLWTFYEAITYWLQANHVIPSVSWQSHPGYCIALVLLSPFWADTHFYFTHRLLHWAPLYRRVHSLHHKNINFGPWSGLAMHPLEHLLYFSVIILYWIIPAHAVHFVGTLQSLALGPTLTHHGFDRVRLAKFGYLNTDHFMHYLHHKYVTVNYGVNLVPFDRWLGTFHDGSKEGLRKAGGAYQKRAARSVGPIEGSKS